MSNILQTFLITLIASCACLWAASAAAETVYTDTVLQNDTTWSGDIEIKGVVVVGRMTTLTISPGTIVRFKKIDTNRDNIGDSELRVLGRLVAVGNASAPIVFKSAEDIPVMRDWSYVLIFTSAFDNRLQYCRFEHGFSGLQVHFSNAVVSDCIFTNNNEGIRFGRARLDLVHNSFSHNEVGVRFTRMEGPVNIRHNRITNNRIGIFLVPSGQNIMNFFEPDRSGRPWNTGKLTITANDIYSNFWYNLSLGEKQIWDLDVKNNWWGTTNRKRINQTIFDRDRDSSLGEALFEPFLTTPSEEAGIRR